MPPEQQQEKWTDSINMKLRTLEAESTVPIGLLIENPTLVKMIKNGDSKDACLNFINENW